MTTWTIDPAHTNAEFSIKHMMFATVRGNFSEVSGTVSYDPENVANSSVEATISTASINTGVEDRDAHLRSGDFFDVEKFPNITFKSTRVEPTGDNAAKVYGDLTIKDVTREVVLDAQFLGQGVNPWGQNVAGFTAETKINREDWGLTWNQALEAGGWLVGKDVKITLNVEVSPVQESETADTANA